MAKPIVTRRRVARIGGNNSNSLSDKISQSDDVVSEILRNMDNQKYSNNLPSAKQIIDCKNLIKCNTSKQATECRKKNKVNCKLPKRIAPTKKFPLMEKTQKNMKILKHNRTIPKQRAHVASFENTTNVLPVQNDPNVSAKVTNQIKEISQNPICLNNVTAQKRKRINCKSNLSHTSTSSDSETVKTINIKKPKACKTFQNNASTSNNEILMSESGFETFECGRNKNDSKNLLSSSDSEAEFESFIRAHKEFNSENSDAELPIGFKKKKFKKTSKNKKLKSSKKSLIKTKKIKPKASSSNLLKSCTRIMISESEDSQPLEQCSAGSPKLENCDSIVTENQSIELNSNITLNSGMPESNTRVMIPGSDDNQHAEFCCGETSKSEGIVIENQSIESDSNGTLDVSVLKSKEHSFDDCTLVEKNISVSNDTLSKNVEVIQVDSDDECIFVCEISKSSQSAPKIADKNSLDPICQDVDLLDINFLEAAYAKKKYSDPAYINTNSANINITRENYCSDKTHNNVIENDVGNIKIQSVKSLAEISELSKYELSLDNNKSLNSVLNYDKFMKSDPFKHASKYCEIQNSKFGVQTIEPINFYMLNEHKIFQQPSGESPQSGFQLFSDKDVFWQNINNAVIHSQKASNSFRDISIQTTLDNSNECIESTNKGHCKISEYLCKNSKETAEVYNFVASHIYDLNFLMSQDLNHLLNLLEKEKKQLDENYSKQPDGVETALHKQNVRNIEKAIKYIAEKDPCYHAVVKKRSWQV